MVKKRNNSNRKRTKTTPVKKRVVRITSNPFLNFFLSVCKLKGNRHVENVAKHAAIEWRKLDYLDKTPYYLLADEAKRRKKKSTKKKEVEKKHRHSYLDEPMMVSRKELESFPMKMKSETEIGESHGTPRKIQQRRKSEGAKRKKSVSSVDSDAALTSDAEGIEGLIDISEKDLRRRKFWPDEASESSFGLSTSVSGSTMDFLPSESSADFGDVGKDLHRTYDFYQ